MFLDCQERYSESELRKALLDNIIDRKIDAMKWLPQGFGLSTELLVQVGAPSSVLAPSSDARRP